MRILKSVFCFLIKFHSISTKDIMHFTKKYAPYLTRQKCDINAQQETRVLDINSICFTLWPQSKCFGQTKLDFHTQINRFQRFIQCWNTRHIARAKQNKTKQEKSNTGDNEKRFINLKFINKTQVVIVLYMCRWWWVCVCVFVCMAHSVDYKKHLLAWEFINHQIIKSE